MTDDSEMEQGRLEEIVGVCPVAMFAKDETSPGKITNCYINGEGLSEPMFYVRENGDYVPNFDRLAIVPREQCDSLRAENDALKQQLQALRERDHMCRELVQEIADSKIC